MKIQYKTNLKGYLSLLRGIQLLLKDKTLTFAQLGTYICFVFQADFDRRHKNYSTIIRDDVELAKEWGCNKTTVYRHRMQLIAKGLLTEKDGLTKVTDFYLFELEYAKLFANLMPAILKTLFTKPHDQVAKEEYFVAEMQKKQLRNMVQSSNISSKVDLSLSEEHDVISDMEEVLKNSSDQGGDFNE